jgi:hypothetical protein
MDTELDTPLDEVDATDLVIDEEPEPIDDGDYEEIIVLDLRRFENHDCWLN